MKKVIALFLMLSISLGSSITSNATSQEHEVLGTYVEAGAVGTEFSVEIAWDGLDFTYNEAQREWDEVNHTYTETTSAGWTTGEKGTITITNHSNTAIAVKPTYEATSGYEAVSMTYSNLNADNELLLATADSGVEGVNGNATESKFYVTPEGVLTKGANGTTIGKISIAIEETDKTISVSKKIQFGVQTQTINGTDGMTWEEYVQSANNMSMGQRLVYVEDNNIRSSWDDSVKYKKLKYTGTDILVKATDQIRSCVEYEFVSY